MLKKTLITVGVMLFVICMILFSQTKVPYKSYDANYLSISDMKDDITQLEKDFMKTHPTAKEDPELYKTFFSDLTNSIVDEMTNSEFSTILAVKFATLNDGHTQVVPEIDGPTLPLILKIIDGDYFVLKGFGDIEVGDKIISIGGVDIQDIYKEYSLQFSAENIYWKQELFEEIYIEINKVIGLGGRKTLFGGMRIEYATEEKTKSLTLYEDDFINGQYNDSVRNEILYTYENNNLVESPYPSFKYSVNNDKNYIYYQILECKYTPDFTKMTDDVFKEVERTEIENMVIDLRGNWGGTTEVRDYFTNRLVAYNQYLERKSDNALKLFVLVDHKTFSAAVDFACAIKDHFNGTMIGQPMGGTLPCYGNSKFDELNHSKLWYAISKNYYKRYDKLIIKNNSILPDVISNYDIYDYANGNDKDLEIVEKIIESDK